MSSPTIHYAGAVYHVMLRGNRQQRLFHEDADYRAFERRVAKSLQRHEARCHAYCWMENHIHLLMQVGIQPIHKVIHHLASGYARWFNVKYEHVGHLFQGRYLASHVDDDPYLVQALRYIHLNPLAAGLVEDPAEYPWSSYGGYFHGRGCSFLATRLVLSLFGADRRAALRACRTFHGQQGDYLPRWDQPAESPAIIAGGLEPTRTLDELVADARSRFVITETLLTSTSRDRLLQQARLWIVQQAAETGCATQAELARRLQRSPQAIHQMLRRSRRREASRL